MLGEAISQVPGSHRKHLLIRADGAGATHGLLDWLSEQHRRRARCGGSVEYSVGFPVTEPLRKAIEVLPKTVWAPALDADGGARDGGDVAELTGCLDPSVLSTSPPGMRIIVRRERPHPGAQLSLFEHRDRWRYQAFATHTTTGQLARLEARHRTHARVEDRIRHAKDTGLGRFPAREYGINQAWTQLVALAADLVAWLRLLALTGDAAPLAACEPKALRYRLLHVPARLTRGARRRRLRLPQSWPWVDAIVAAFTNITALPAPVDPAPPTPTPIRGPGEPQTGSAAGTTATPSPKWPDLVAILSRTPALTPPHERPGLALGSRWTDHKAEPGAR